MMYVIGFLLVYSIIGLLVAFGSMMVEARNGTVDPDTYLPIFFFWPFWLLILCVVLPIEFLAEFANEHGRNSRS